MVRAKQVGVLKDKLVWCYKRESTNRFQKCRELEVQYAEMLREYKSLWIKPMPLPKDKRQIVEDEE